MKHDWVWMPPARPMRTFGGVNRDRGYWECPCGFQSAGPVRTREERQAECEREDEELEP